VKSQYFEARHGEGCETKRIAGCTCTLAALEAYAAKWLELCAITGDDPANAGRWMKDAALYRKIKAAVDRYADVHLIAFVNRYGIEYDSDDEEDLEGGVEGKTLDEAVDKLPEAE
jgi:hypothetical protein